MAKVLRFSSRQCIAAEASEWLSKLDRGLHKTEKEQLDQWLAVDPRHAEMLVDMAALWDDMGQLRELSGLVPLVATRSATRRDRRWLGVGVAVLASLAVAAVSLQLLLPGVDDQLPGGAVSASRPLIDLDGILTTAIGDQQVESLPDGSVLQINTDSRVEILFSALERRVVVHRGEVHFEVRSDSARPFVVDTAGGRIEAIGTAFNVHLRDDARLEVLVTEGSVMISRPQASGPLDGRVSNPLEDALRLTAGELATLEPSRHLVRQVSMEERSSRLAWQRGMLIFNGEGLEAALQEVTRYTDIRFEILDDELRQVRIGGVYKAGDVAGLVRSLGQNFEIQITHDEAQRTVELRRR